MQFLGLKRMASDGERVCLGRDCHGIDWGKMEVGRKLLGKTAYQKVQTANRGRRRTSRGLQGGQK